jgi:hypothetical protein
MRRLTSILFNKVTFCGGASLAPPFKSFFSSSSGQVERKRHGFLRIIVIYYIALIR